MSKPRSINVSNKIGIFQECENILLFIIFSGASTYISIPKESTPDVSIPIVYISLHQNGISAQDSERLLVKPIEDEVKTVEGVKEVRSTAYSGGGNVLLEFDAGFDSDQAMIDIRDKVDRAKGDLPSEADEPTVNEVNISTFPIIQISLSGDVPNRTLQDLADILQNDIETIPSVLEAKIGGKRNEQVDILINPTAVESYGINLESLINIVRENNKMVSAGGQDTGDGSFDIKVPGLYETIEDVLNTPVKTNGDSVITFRDIAEVKRTFEDRQSYANVNGSKSITIDVSKRIGENIINTIDEVKRVTSITSKSFPDNVEISFGSDQSKGIKTMYKKLLNTVNPTNAYNYVTQLKAIEDKVLAKIDNALKEHPPQKLACDLRRIRCRLQQCREEIGTFHYTSAIAG